MSQSDELLTTEKIKLLTCSDDRTCATFSIDDEDHTLGNLLRYILMKDPNVELAAYSIPHPSDNVIHLRIQTLNMPAVVAFDNALSNLTELVTYLEDSWDEAIVNH